VYREKLDSFPPSERGPQSAGEMKSYIGNCQDWHAHFLFDAYRHDWNARDNGDMAEFSAYLDRSARLGSKARFCRMLRKRLEFMELYDREARIIEAHQRTLEWLFRGPNAGAEGGSWDDFSEWLRRDDDNDRSHIYWITGKPGSGKSTLMKYLYRDARTAKLLKQWAGGNTGVEIAAFFFWNSGTKMQMTHLGLLRSLLFQMLEGRPELILKAFPERWELYELFCAGMHPWSLEELKQAFGHLVSDTSRRWFFIIDGLDEFDGDHGQLTELVLKIGKRPNVKLCVASRPWLVFGDAFEDGPSLQMEDLTADDIKHYVTSSFDGNKHYRRLRSRQPKLAESLAAEIVRKSSGVFLWVYLVVQSLLKGLSDCDHLSSLQARLDASPPGLDELFSKMFGSLEPAYFSHACQLIQVVEAAREPLTLLGLSFADEDDPAAAFLLPVQPLNPAEAQDRALDMERRLNSRCKGLIEAPVRSGSVQYLHRTARDFIRDPKVWSNIVNKTPENFDANRLLLNSSLSLLKTENPVTMRLDGFWHCINRCIMYADLIREDDREAIQHAYVDIMDRAAITLTTRMPTTGPSKQSWLQGYTLPNQPHHWASTGSGTLTSRNCLEFALRTPGSALTSYACVSIRQMPALGRGEVALLRGLATDKRVLDVIKEVKVTKKRRWFRRSRSGETVGRSQWHASV